MKRPADLRGRLDGKTAVVTGGTRGIGQAIVLRLAAAGARVATCYQQDAAAPAALEESGTTILVVKADLADKESVSGLVTACREYLGELDILVNNVDIDARESLTGILDARAAHALDANLATLHRITMAFLPLMGRGASIVNVGPRISTRGVRVRTQHATAKAGITGFSRSLARELGPHGIRVNAVAPGVIETEPDAGRPHPIARQIAAATSLGRLGGPDELASVVVFLAGDLSSYVTGTTIAVDGGM